MPIPEDHDAEQQVIGMMIVNPGCVARATALLAPTHFYTPAHARLFTAAQEMAAVTLERTEAERHACWLDDDDLALVASVMAPAPLWAARACIDAVTRLAGVEGLCERVRRAWEDRAELAALERRRAELTGEAA